MLIRFARRVASWEEQKTVEDLRELEFRDRDGNPDLNVSVYELEASEVVRAYAEHAIRIEPKRTALGLEAPANVGQQLITPGTTGFQFTRERHRELTFSNVLELDRLIQGILDLPDGHMHRILKTEIEGYVRRCLEKSDQEWCTVLESGACSKWFVQLAKAIPRATDSGG